MPSVGNCPNCSSPLSSEAPEGLCPKCLLQAGLGGTTEPPALSSDGSGTKTPGQTRAPDETMKLSSAGSNRTTSSGSSTPSGSRSRGTSAGSVLWRSAPTASDSPQRARTRRSSSGTQPLARNCSVSRGTPTASRAYRSAPTASDSPPRAATRRSRSGWATNAESDWSGERIVRSAM
jgi:hypothetical protein